MVSRTFPLDRLLARGAGVLMLLVSCIGAAAATTCPCKDQSGKGFGFLECEPQQSGFCLVDKGAVRSWCKTPPPETRESAEKLKRWIIAEVRTVHPAAGPLLLLETGIYVTGGTTVAIPRTLPAVRAVDLEAKNMRIRFADKDPAGLAPYQQWRRSAVVAPALKPNPCGERCQRDDCGKAALGIERDACLHRCNIRCGMGH
jgi:hypothetical protein